ncbi:MAG: tetratricopeptide repeat protein [Bacteroidetes bacterium]|nr:tetratricopeptide repeat protein [Bacteroidota bacterium]
MKSKQTLEELNAENETTTLDNSSEAGGVNAFIQKNWKTIIILSAAVIVLIGLIYLFQANSKQNEYNASKYLARIETYFLEGRYEDALYAPDSLPLIRKEKVKGLIKIVEEYGSTKAGDRASLYTADAFYQLGKYAEAKTYYEKVISSKIPDIKLGGYAGLGACNERDGKLEDAAANYLKAVELISEEGLKLRYMYFAGLCTEKTGKKDEAIKIYRDIINYNKFGEFNNMAKAGIVRLGDVIE